MNSKFFKDKTFDELPEKISFSNFIHCIFNASTVFDRCNLIGCTYNKPCTYIQSNVVSKEDEKGHTMSDMPDDLDFLEMPPMMY